LEDDISSVRKEQIKEHLSLCPDCRRDYKRLKFVLSHLSQIEKDEIKAPPDFVDSLMARLDQFRKNVWQSGFASPAAKNPFDAFMDNPARNVLIGAAMVATAFLVGVEVKHRLDRKVQIKSSL
jgi:hypothetical protein